MNVEEVKQYMENHQEKIVADLAGFIEIPSVSSHKEEVDRALDYVLDLATRMGFTAKAVCDHQVGVIEVGDGDETVGILSHVDVVPAGDLESWERDPYMLVVENDRLYGRGTMDDKGAIIVCLHAMKAVVDSGKPLHKKIQMILGTQEEVEWVDMNRYVKEYPLPDYGFTPDGEFPLCNIEKGGLDIPMLFTVDGQPQGDGWYLTNVDAGTVANAVPGECFAQITRFREGDAVETKELRTTGKAVHSCQPEKGDNAIFQMAKMLEALQLKDNDLLRLLNMTDEKFSSLYGKEVGLYSDSDIYNGEFVHRNVFAPTLFKVEGDEVLIHLNIRFAYGTDSGKIVEAIEKLARSYGGRTGDVTCLPAVYVSKDRPFMGEFGKAYEEGCGRKHEFVLAYGGSYAKAMPNIVSWGPIFPDDEDTCHEDNEYITMKSLMDNGKIFAIALSRVVLSEKHFK